MAQVWLRPALAASWTGACTFESDYRRTRYRCEQGGSCPSGYPCRRGHCEPIATGAHPDAGNRFDNLNVGVE